MPFIEPEPWLKTVSMEEFQKKLDALIQESATASELLLATCREFSYGQRERCPLTQEQSERVVNAIVNFSKIKAAQEANHASTAA